MLEILNKFINIFIIICYSFIILYWVNMDYTTVYSTTLLSVDIQVISCISQLQILSQQIIS